MTNEIGIPPYDQAIGDRLAIQDVINGHCRGLDRLDEALLQACYWPEAEVDYGAYRGPALPFAELVVEALGAQYELTQHCLSNTMIELRGKQALAESYVSAAHLLPGAQQEMLFSGRYLDTLEQREGSWKLLHRRVVMDWSRRRPVTDERNAEAFAAMAKGGHGASDPLDEFLRGIDPSTQRQAETDNGQ